jgi:Ca2+-binding EF-hand superfamily protein
VDVDGTGVVSKKDMHRLGQSFNDYVASHANVVKLIQICDANGDSVLDPGEVRELLKASSAAIPWPHGPIGNVKSDNVPILIHQ